MGLYSPFSIIVLFVVFPGLGLITTALRFYIRLRLQRPPKVWIDDWFILAGAILSISLNFNGLIATIYGGLGRHTQLSAQGQPIPTPRLRTTLHAVYPQDIIEKVTYGLVKLSILFFYRRIFSVQNFRRVNTVIIVIIGLWTVIFFTVTIFECGVHPDVQWTSPHDVQDYCIDTARLLLLFAITDVITDIMVLVLPIREVWRLQMSKRNKYAVTGIFALGALSTAAGIVRLALVIMASNVDFGASSDTLGKLTPPFVWTNLEVSIGVIAASLPTLGPLRKAYRQNVRAHFRSSESHSVSLVAVSEQISQMNSASKGFQKLHSESYLEVSALHAGKRTESQNEGGKPDSKQPGINDSLA